MSNYYDEYFGYEDIGLKRHKISDTIKWVIIFLLMIGVIGAVITLFVMLDRQTTVTEIGPEAYTIATLDENGVQTEGDTSIVTRDMFAANGLKVELSDEASVTYRLFFYDGEGNFISATGDLYADFDGEIPENAAYAKCEVTPTADEDGKVDLTEVLGYAGQVTITVNR